jgi:hypothetical protein
MPDQPDDPVHYDMKIPPEPQNAPLNKQREEQRGSDEVTAESNNLNQQAHEPNANPPRPSQSGNRSDK